MYQLTYSDEMSPDGTGYNDFPKGWRKLTEKQFAQSGFFINHVAKIEHRQMHKNNKVVMAILYWMEDNTGFAVEHDYWKGKIYYYAFGCNHKWRELGGDECRERNIPHLGMCWHVTECEHCKRINSYDSSD